MRCNPFKCKKNRKGAIRAKRSTTEHTHADGENDRRIEKEGGSGKITTDCCSPTGYGLDFPQVLCLSPVLSSQNT